MCGFLVSGSVQRNTKVYLCTESKAWGFCAARCNHNFIFLTLPFKILDFEERYAVRSSTPFCPNTNVYAYRLHFVWVYYFNIRHILTTHYVGQSYNCGINFKIKTKQRHDLSHDVTRNFLPCLHHCCVPFIKNYWSLNRTQI